MAVDVPGGRLTVTVTDDSCWLSGPAVLIATGELTPPALPSPPAPPAPPR
jgi:diaminopimelate epimerase